MAIAVTEAEIEDALDDARKLIDRLVDERNAMQGECDTARDSLDKADTRIAELEELLADDDALTEALTSVRYWMLDVLTHGRTVSSPTKMLRIVEGRWGYDQSAARGGSHWFRSCRMGRTADRR